MRGKVFHNTIVEQAATICESCGWRTSTEHRYCRNGITKYFDIFATKDGGQIAIEIETSSRHILDTAIKVKSLGVELWIIVPTRKLQRYAQKKLFCTNPASSNHPVKILLLGSLKSELQNFF